MKARIRPRSSMPLWAWKRLSSAAMNACCTCSGMSASATQSRRWFSSNTSAKRGALAVEHHAGAGELESPELVMVREVGGRLVVEIDHLAEVDRGLGDLLVLAELPVGDVQVGKIDAAERLDLAGKRFRVVQCGGDQLVEVDVLDVEGLAHMGAAGLQQPGDLLLVAGAVELGFHRVRRGRDLTERQGGRKNLDEEGFHRAGEGSRAGRAITRSRQRQYDKNSLQMRFPGPRNLFKCAAKALMSASGHCGAVTMPERLVAGRRCLQPHSRAVSDAPSRRARGRRYRPACARPARPGRRPARR